jgi:hypothetical protein
MPTSLRRPLPGTGRPRLLAGVVVLAVALSVVPASVAHAETGSDYVPLTSATRLAHTPNGTGGFTGPRPAGSTTAYQVAGRAGVPATGASAVMLDVAAVTPPNGTTLTLFPDGQPSPPTVTMLNAPAGKTISNSAVVPIGANGKIAVYTSSVSGLSIDIQGYFTQGGGAGTSRFLSVPQTRIVDSRNGTGVAKAKIPNGGSVSFLATTAPIPSGASAIVANIAVPTPSAGGWLAVHPTGTTPSTSTIDYIQGSTTSSGAAVRVGTGGRITIVNHGPSVDVVIDVQGYFSTTATGAGTFRPATARLYDSRLVGTGAKVGANATVEVAVGGTNGLPLRGFTGAALNVAAAAATATGSLRVWPTGDPEPTTVAVTHYSTVSFARSDGVMVRPGRDGKVTIRNVASSPVHVVVDLQGWFAPATAPLPVEQFSRSSIIQGANNMLEYAWVNNIGQLYSLRQLDPRIFASNENIVTVLSGSEAFTGQPAVGLHGDGRLQVTAQHTDRDSWARSRASAATSDWTLPWADLGGSMAAPPAVGRLPDGRLVVFGVDVDGQLWHQPQTSVNGGYGGWSNLGDADLVGTPTIGTLSDGLALAALDTGGRVKVAVYRAGGLSAWTSLGGSGFSGSPAVVVLPGNRLRIVARGAGGAVMTKQQDGVGGWPAAWDTISGFTSAGSPAAVLSPFSSRIEVVARGADGTIYSTGETASGSNVWRSWVVVPGSEGLAAADPTAFTYNNTTRLAWAFVVRDVDQDHWAFPDEQFAGLSGAAARSAEADRPPSFAKHAVSQPER